MHLRLVPRPVEATQQTTLVVVVLQRLGLLVVRLEALLDRLGLVVLARNSGLPSWSQTSSCLGGSNSTWYRCPLEHWRRPESRCSTTSSDASIDSAAVSRRPSFSSSSVSASAWPTVRGKPSSRKPSSPSSSTLCEDHGDDELVGDEVTVVHVLLGLDAELGAVLPCARAAGRRCRCRRARSPPAGARPGCPYRPREDRGE